MHTSDKSIIILISTDAARSFQVTNFRHVSSQWSAPHDPCI